MLKSLVNYFSEFKVLRDASREFWFINMITVFDSLAYFSMVNIITLYLSTNCGFSDVDSGVWVGIYTLYITAFVFGVGAVCDSIGIKKSYFIGLGLLVITRAIMGFAPALLTGDLLKYSVMGAILAMSLGTAFMSPIHNTAMRRFTTKENRSTGFNVYYLLMNVGAALAGLVTDGFRGFFGDVKGNLAIMTFGVVMYGLSFIITMILNENNYADESERVEKGDVLERPLKVFMEVWKESAFQKLVLFLLLTLGVRLVFTHQFLVMPKYYTRVLSSDFELGMANAINPVIIIVGLILLIPITKKFDTFRSIVWGMTISALSLLIMAIPLDFFLKIPGIHNYDSAYKFIIFSQIAVFAFGELLFSPRFTEYIAVVAPKEKVGSYMSLSALPMFIAKPINGFFSGVLIAAYSYDGIRAKIDSGNLTYEKSPEYMWMIYFLIAALSPIAVIAMKNVINSGRNVAKKETESLKISEPEPVA